MTSKQVELWSSEFGAEYAKRNANTITREGQQRLMRDWGRMLDHAVTPAPQSVLEVGCNIGRNLVALKNFISEIHAVDPNAEAIKVVKNNPDLADVKANVGHGLDLAYDNQSIDLVFTSGVLIHVSPDDLGKVVDEVYRVSKRYILCVEYFSHQPTEVNYHGKEGYLFKRDFGGFYLNRFPDLRVLDYGFLWQPLDSSDNSNWWLFAKP